jgi:hypothetical protein
MRKYKILLLITTWASLSFQPVRAGEITSLSPTSVIAGAWEELTISGSGFGDEAGQVWWTSGDSNRGQSQITHFGWEGYLQEWSDNRIRIIVPTDAGSGIVQVRTNTGEEIDSTGMLVVHFNLGNVDQFYEKPSSAILIDNNREGGYTFYFDNSVPEEARIVFERALNKWVAAVGVNWTVDETGDALVKFSELVEPKLGHAVTSTSFISSNPGQAKVTGLGIEFKVDANWYYGENANGIGAQQSDFESVALHELGHCLQLNHVNDSGDLMHSVSETGETLRDITPSALAGAFYIRANAPTMELWGSNPMNWLSDLPPALRGGTTVTLNVMESQTEVTSVTATDVDGDTLTYSISGSDAELFVINAATGELNFAAQPDFEIPIDTDSNNVYEVVVTVSDGALWDLQTITVTVTNVDEPPVVANAIPDVAATEDDANQTISLSNVFNDVDDANGSITKAATSSNTSLVKVAVNGNVLTLAYQPNQSGSATITVTATSNGKMADDSFEVAVEPLPQVTLASTIEGQGNVTGAGNYESGTSATLTATADEGWVFSNWAGNANGSINPLAVSMTTSRNIKAVFISSASWNLGKDEGHGWYSFPWFGIYFETSSGWIYHLSHGWLYRSGQTTTSTWFFDQELGWLWTSASTYPFLYRSDSNVDDGWLYYETGSKEPRRFFNYQRNSWVDVSAN